MMTVRHEKKANGAKVIVSGLVKTIEDSTNFKNAITEVIESYGKESIVIHFEDSFIITSSVIGTLLKMVKKDEVDISLVVYKDDLYDLLDKLGMVELLKVKRA